MYLVDISSRLDKEASKLLYGCRTMNWYTYPSPLCRCQLSSLDHIPCARYFYSKQLRKQACCDWWLGKLLEGKGEHYVFWHKREKITWRWFFLMTSKSVKQQIYFCICVVLFFLFFFFFFDEFSLLHSCGCFSLLIILVKINFLQEVYFLIPNLKEKKVYKKEITFF